MPVGVREGGAMRVLHNTLNDDDDDEDGFILSLEENTIA